MSRVLARLYPRAFREYWGEEFTGAISGWRDAPDLVREAVRLWAHPALWPAGSTAERRTRARTAGLAVAVLAGWVLALLAEFDGDRSPVALLALIAGAALLIPWAGLGRLVRALVFPALVGAVIVVVANGTSLGGHDQPVAALVVIAWWATLAWAGATLVRGLAATGSAPRFRLGGGLAAVAVGGAGAAAEALARHHDPAGLAAAAVFALLATIALTTLIDLRLLPAR